MSSLVAVFCGTGFLCPPASADQQLPAFPRFRHADPGQAKAYAVVNGPLTLLADSDFGPWSFAGEDGGAHGIAVDIALSACHEARLACVVKLVPHGDLLAALSRGEGQVIVAGLRPDAALFKDHLFTRPYYVSMARFVMRQGAAIQSNDARALSGKRLAVVQASLHERFLQQNYPKATVTAFARQSEMLEALRTGAVDAAFGDAVNLAYWLAGSASRNCCQMLGKAFIDRDNFSRDLVMVTQPDARPLRDNLDQALDALEERGDTAQIFMRYLPGPVW